MPDSSPSPSGEKYSTASLLGGAALVGAAAGYALLALRFKNFGSTANNAGRFAAGSAEMRAADAFTKEWVRNVEREGATGGRQHASAGASHESTQRQQQRQAFENLASGPPSWALKELGLPGTGAPSLDEAKKAYHTRAKSLHPDAPGGGDEAAFKRLTKAMEEIQATAIKS